MAVKHLYLIFIHRKSKENVIKVVINNTLKCEIENKIKIQNLYYDKKTNNLLIISNLVGHHLGMIYKLPIRTLCKKDNLNFFNIKNKELIFYPFYELEVIHFVKIEIILFILIIIIRIYIQNNESTLF